MRDADARKVVVDALWCDPKVRDEFFDDRGTLDAHLANLRTRRAR